MSTAHDRAQEEQKKAGAALDDAVAEENRARRTWRSTPVGGSAGPYARGLLRQAKRRTRKAELRHRAAKRKVAATKPKPVRELAYQEAVKLIGIMEQGGNNRGAAVERIIREGGGLPGQAWCGWFCAAVYRRAGSKAPTWQWGAVRLFVPLSGVSRTSKPQKGDLVRFNFSASGNDHIGMFVKDNGNGTIETIEGNTGATGAVSDSATGGDGVYRKTRSKTLVRDYLHITR